MISLSIKERQELVEFVYHQRKKGASNSDIRTQLKAKKIEISVISGIITEVEIRITTPSNTGIINFLKKSHARIRVIIGAVLFIIGIGGALLSYLNKVGDLQFITYLLLIGISGLGVYSTGKYSLRKIKRANKKFETSLIPFEKL